MSKNLEYRGVATEATWGTSPISDASGTAYWLGVMGTGGLTPWVEREFQRGVVPPAQRHSTSVLTGVQVPRNTLTFAPLDGVPLWYAFGSSSNSGSNPYTHALSYPVGSGASPSEPPSFTWHRERYDGTNYHTLQVTGLRFTRTLVSLKRQSLGGSGLLTVTAEVVGKTQTYPAYNLTSKPSSRISGAKPYSFEMLTTYTVGGAQVDGLLGFELEWSLPITPLFHPSASGGADQSHVVASHVYGVITQPVFRFYYEPESFDPPEKVTATSSFDNVSLVITRGASDTITFTGTNFIPTLVSDPVVVPGSKLEATVVEGVLEQLSCSVVDSLDGSVHYA